MGTDGHDKSCPYEMTRAWVGAHIVRPPRFFFGRADLESASTQWAATSQGWRAAGDCGPYCMIDDGCRGQNVTR